jgi:hypothetical protein
MRLEAADGNIAVEFLFSTIGFKVAQLRTAISVPTEPTFSPLLRSLRISAPLEMPLHNQVRKRTVVC